jgi:hypothetical protein
MPIVFYTVKRIRKCDSNFLQKYIHARTLPKPKQVESKLQVTVPNLCSVPVHVTVLVTVKLSILVTKRAKKKQSATD